MKNNHLTRVATFARNLKELVPVGNFCLVAGEDILEISQDCVLCTYHPIFFRKIQKRFELWSTGSEVSTLTPVDASGLTVCSTNAGTHKIDGPTLKSFRRVEIEDKLERNLFNYKKEFLVANTSREGWSFGLFGATSALQSSLTLHVIHWVV